MKKLKTAILDKNGALQAVEAFGQDYIAAETYHFNWIDVFIDTLIGCGREYSFSMESANRGFCLKWQDGGFTRKVSVAEWVDNKDLEYALRVGVRRVNILFRHFYEVT